VLCCYAKDTKGHSDANDSEIQPNADFLPFRFVLGSTFDFRANGARPTLGAFGACESPAPFPAGHTGTSVASKRLLRLHVGNVSLSKGKAVPPALAASKPTSHPC